MEKSFLNGIWFHRNHGLTSCTRSLRHWTERWIRFLSGSCSVEGEGNSWEDETSLSQPSGSTILGILTFLFSYSAAGPFYDSKNHQIFDSISKSLNSPTCLVEIHRASVVREVAVYFFPPFLFYLSCYAKTGPPCIRYVISALWNASSTTSRLLH